MNNTENGGNNWERIQSGVRETERLLGQKKYNAAMVRARQTLEFMVKCLCERNGIMEAGLIDMIDSLYESGSISKITCEHYHKIRTIGNKAIHEEDNNAYNANQAHHLLSQEVYTFANDYSGRKRRTGTAPAQKAGSRPGPRAQQQTSARSSGRSPQKSRRKGGGSSVNPALIKLLIPLAVVVILIIVILLIPKKKEVNETTVAPTTVEATTVAPTTAAPTETTTAAVEKVYKITANDVRVRDKATKDSNVLGKLAKDTVVEYIRDEGEEWVVIKYNGKEAFVSKQFVAASES